LGVYCHLPAPISTLVDCKPQRRERRALARSHSRCARAECPSGGARAQAKFDYRPSAKLRQQRPNTSGGRSASGAKLEFHGVIFLVAPRGILVTSQPTPRPQSTVWPWPDPFFRH